MHRVSRWFHLDGEAIQLNTRYVDDIDKGLEWAERRSASVIAEAMGDAIRTLSVAAGLTQKSLGDAVGASQGNISDWMRGKRLPPLTTILDIEDACEKPHGTLLRMAGLLEVEAQTVNGTWPADKRPNEVVITATYPTDDREIVVEITTNNPAQPEDLALLARITKVVEEYG